MANIWEKAISTMAGNLNLGHSYLITTVYVNSVIFLSMARNPISRINSNLNKTKNSSLFFYLFFLIKFGTIVSILINQDAIWYDGINQFLSTKSRLALITVMYQILGQLQPEPKHNITRYSKVKISWDYCKQQKQFVTNHFNKCK